MQQKARSFCISTNRYTAMQRVLLNSILSTFCLCTVHYYLKEESETTFLKRNRNIWLVGRSIVCSFVDIFSEYFFHLRRTPFRHQAIPVRFKRFPIVTSVVDVVSCTDRLIDRSTKCDWLNLVTSSFRYLK